MGRTLFDRSYEAPPGARRIVGLDDGLPGALGDPCNLVLTRDLVAAPVSGLVHGVHFSPPGQLDCSRDDCDDTTGRHVERQRPSACGTPENAAYRRHIAPAVVIIGSGAQ
jgi:hypothetical protein